MVVWMAYQPVWIIGPIHGGGTRAFFRQSGHDTARREVLKATSVVGFIENYAAD